MRTNRKLFSLLNNSSYIFDEEHPSSKNIKSISSLYSCSSLESPEVLLIRKGLTLYTNLNHVFYLNKNIFNINRNRSFLTYKTKRLLNLAIVKNNNLKQFYRLYNNMKHIDGFIYTENIAPYNLYIVIFDTEDVVKIKKNKQKRREIYNRDYINNCEGKKEIRKLLKYRLTSYIE